LPLGCTVTLRDDHECAILTSGTSPLRRWAGGLGP
jgi:hypothetical protein